MVLPSGPHPTRSIEAAARSIRGTDLAECVGLTQANLSKLKTGNSKGHSLLDAAGALPWSPTVSPAIC